MNRAGDRRAPHKPLLLLIAIARLLQEDRLLPFSQIEDALNPLLSAYAPPVKSRHQPELPYWHLQSDGLWEVAGGSDFPRQAGGFPKMAALRSSEGSLEAGFAEALLTDRSLLLSTIQILLNQHFPESIHADIVESVGLSLPQQEIVADRELNVIHTRKRDPSFRQRVLRAYEHRCAVTGFRAALGGQYLGCEAAHVRWHAYDGPDSVENGFAAEPTIHKLFDAGAWTLTDDRRVLVSADLTGTDDTIARIRGFHGQALKEPLPGERQVSVEHIRWHRQPDQGGVFRGPALAL